MMKIQQFDCRLTKLEWEALQAALPHSGGVPLMTGLVESLPVGANCHELFVLKGKQTRDLSATFYVLLGWGDDDDIVSPYPYPDIFAIYADEHYREALPSFDDLYRKGLEQLRRRVSIKAKRDAWQYCYIAAAVTLIVWIINNVGAQPVVGPGELLQTGLRAMAQVFGVGAFVGLVALIALRWWRLRAIPKPAV